MKTDMMKPELSDYVPQSSPMTGRRVLLIVLAFFGVVIAANMTMLYFAVTNFSGLVVKNSYVAGQSFEADQARARAAALTGWKVSVEPSAVGVDLVILDQAGAPVAQAELSGVIGRRSHVREDRAVSFTRVEPGRFRGETQLEPGAWRLIVSDAATPEVARKIDFFLAAPKPAGRGDGS